MVLMLAVSLPVVTAEPAHQAAADTHAAAAAATETHHPEVKEEVHAATTATHEATHTPAAH